MALLSGTVNGLCTSLAVNVLLLGPLLWFYFEIPPYSVFLNLIVIPVMPAAMGAGVAGSALTVLSDTAGGMVLQVCRGVLYSYDRLCEWTEILPGSRFVAGKPGVLYTRSRVIWPWECSGLFTPGLCTRELRKKSGEPVGDTRIRSGREDAGCRAGEPFCWQFLWLLYAEIPTRSAGKFRLLCWMWTGGRDPYQGRIHELPD